ncbi:RDD family protein [Pseudactinotalea sp. HY158]|uniref:RDD family protein n=1 Tax=Pseudactinotalea sp. HY158 TaxID=2654547 RepID=UPI0018922508|nr:RDD family protein [Pseudactinotalea sp. HY158]
MQIHPLAGRRMRAYLLDATGYLGVAAAMVPAGLVLSRNAPPSPGAVLRTRTTFPMSAVLPMRTVLPMRAVLPMRTALRTRAVLPMRAVFPVRAVLLMSAVPPIVATIWAARAEAGADHATWGKRRMGLMVATERGPALEFPRALARNAIKIAIPWQVGHLVAIGAVAGGFDRSDPLTLTAGILIYPIIGAFAVMSAFGSGRGPHDRLTATHVIAR